MRNILIVVGGLVAVAAIGSSLVVNGRPMRIVGVAPQGFTGTTPGAHPLVFVPLTMRAAVSG